MYLSVPFILQNFYKKNVRVDLELWGCARFLGPKQPICPEQKLTMKSYNGSRIMAMHHFWTQSGPFTSNNFFFRKPVNHPYVFYSCLSTWQKSKSDINLLVKYWWLKNTEISLAESHFCLYLRTRFFPSMQFSQDVNEP